MDMDDLLATADIIADPEIHEENEILRDRLWELEKENEMHEKGNFMRNITSRQNKGVSLFKDFREAERRKRETAGGFPDAAQPGFGPNISKDGLDSTVENSIDKQYMTDASWTYKNQIQLGNKNA